jgi:hypothetical protein
LSLATEFAIQSGAALIGVFGGVLSALWVERRRRSAEEARQRAREAARLGEVRDLLLSSVVRNTSEAKRLLGMLGESEDPYHFQVAFDMAVWEATRDQFVGLAPLDQRVQFALFFDQIRHVSHLLDFQRQVRAQHEVSQTRTDVGDRDLFDRMVARLRTVVEDVRLNGLIIVGDHGTTLQKRMVGMTPSAAPT